MPFPALFDLERVEVLRGSSRNALRGGFRRRHHSIHPAHADLHTDSVYIRSELATTKHGDPTYELGAAVGGPLIDDKLGFRISASYREDGGWVDHVGLPHPGHHEIGFQLPGHRRGTRGLEWAPTDTVSVTPSIYYQELRLGDTSAYWPSLSNPGASRFENGNAQRNPSTDPFFLSAVKIEWDAGFAHFTSNTSYYARNQHSISDYTQFDRALFGLPVPPVPGDLGTLPRCRCAA